MNIPCKRVCLCSFFVCAGFQSLSRPHELLQRTRQKRSSANGRPRLRQSLQGQKALHYIVVDATQPSGVSVCFFLIHVAVMFCFCWVFFGRVFNHRVQLLTNPQFRQRLSRNQLIGRVLWLRRLNRDPRWLSAHQLWHAPRAKWYDVF